MTTIHMEVETVRSTARQLNSQASEFLSCADALKRAAGALSVGWQGSGAEEFQNNLRMLVERIATQSQELETLSLRAGREADEWEAADSGAASAFRDHGGSGWFGPVAGAFGWAVDGADLVAKAVIAGGITAGATYAGQAIFYGGRTIKDLAGVNNLTHIRATNLPKFMVKGSPFDTKTLSGRLAIAGAAIEIADRGIQDWSKYRSGNERAAALIVDGAFVVGKGFLQHYGGYMAASAATAGLLLAVPAAPVAVVGAVGMGAWWVGSQAVGWAADKGFDAIKEPLVKGTTKVVDKAVDFAKSTGGAIKSGGEKVVDTVFVNPAKKLKSLFS